jgi:hypothetical protein
MRSWGNAGVFERMKVEGSVKVLAFLVSLGLGVSTVCDLVSLCKRIYNYTIERSRAQQKGPDRLSENEPTRNKYEPVRRVERRAARS